mgnify:CR=1 FL=1
MRKILFLLVVLIVGFTVSDVQKESVLIDWSAPEGSYQLENGIASYLQHNDSSDLKNKLPVYTRLYSLENSTHSYKFVIENPRFELVDSASSDKFVEVLADHIMIESKILKSGNSYKNLLEVVPFKREGSTIYRLTSFDIKRIPVTAQKNATKSYTWKSSSVLSSGKWMKVSTSGKGIYKIPFSTLSDWGFTNPALVNVYGMGGLALSENPGEIAYDDLPQCSVWYDTNNGEQCLFFYAPGVTDWSLNSQGYFIHKNNNYATRGFFFLAENSDDVKSTELYPEWTDDATHTITEFDEFTFHEDEKYNLLPLGSGKQWFGDKFSRSTNRSYSLTAPGAVAGEPASLVVNAASRSYQNSSMDVSAAGEEAGTVNFTAVNTNDTYGLYADESRKQFPISVSADPMSISITYNAGNQNAEAWLDYIELIYKRKLSVETEPLFFRDAASVGAGNTLEISIEDGSADTKVLDVSSISEVTEVPVSLNGNTITGKRPADQLREYVVFNPNGDFKTPTLAGEVENQNLHGLRTPEYLIISHPNFMGAAEELAAFHRDMDGMDVAVINVEKVYNEFSSGTKNATGIRNFIKMFYDRGEQLKYVLLFGDGSYDNKGVNPDSRNYIPTYQSDNSLTPTSSFVTDDYFVLLDSDESVYNGAIDLGIGRIPSSTAYEAQLVVDKVRRYYDAKALGSWRNIISFIGDDEDTGLHMRQSEELADSVNSNNSAFVTDKIYFDAYVESVTPSGQRYPDVNAAINQRVKDGVLILNYVGHANERFLAHERVLDISDINAWSNSSQLPIFVTATCEFSRFDGNETSAGEYVLFNANGGGIGLFSTTRVVYATANFRLSKSFYNHIFDNDEKGEHYRMGDVMRLAKVNIGNSINKRNFSLLADPALKLSFPMYRIITSTINEEDAESTHQNIGALQKVTVTGFVADAFGNKVDAFNGTLIPTVYDKEVLMNTLGNNGQTPVSFKVRENIIYKGKSSVQNGEFSFSFVVPKDISYNLGEGKIQYYADNGSVDAHGAYTNFDIGGSGSSISDNQGPDIKVFLDSPDFRSGDKTGRNPILLANLSDENGINTVGTGVGHDITAVIDNNYSNAIVLNNHYQANTDDYTSGSITYPLSNLSVGTHTLKLKAWDVANNSTEVEIEFEVTSDFVITEISNYPNPVSDYTYFVLEHNQSGASFDVIFDIYDSFGRSVDRFQTRVGSNGSTTNPVRWDLAESKIAATPGIYIYRAIVQNSEGIITSKSGKMTIAR